MNISKNELRAMMNEEIRKDRSVRSRRRGPRSLSRVSLRKVINEEARQILLEQDVEEEETSVELGARAPSTSTPAVELPQELQDVLDAVEAAVAELTTSPEAVAFEERLAAAVAAVPGYEGEFSTGAGGTSLALPKK